LTNRIKCDIIKHIIQIGIIRIWKSYRNDVVFEYIKKPKSIFIIRRIIL